MVTTSERIADTRTPEQVRIDEIRDYAKWQTCNWEKICCGQIKHTQQNKAARILKFVLGRKPTPEEVSRLVGF